MLLTVVPSWVLMPVPAAAAQQVGCTTVKTAAGVTIGSCTGSGGASQPGISGQRRPIELITAVSSTPETGSCTIRVRTTSEPGVRELSFRQAIGSLNDAFNFFMPRGLLNELWTRVVAGLPGCPSTSPRDVAFSFVRDIVPPGPDPWIAPGFALTGKLAFLETRSPTQVPDQYDTPLGTLSVVLKATMFAVDWGDESTTDDGPFAAPGEPWPHGAARHSYTTVGRYDVVVTQSWDAEWQLSGERGVVRGLTSTGGLDDFEVRQLQAVRNI
ncbi:MAG: hypothetical protein ACRD0N_00045 [Acidimicrobiales bacterium]